MTLCGLDLTGFKLKQIFNRIISSPGIFIKNMKIVLVDRILTQRVFGQYSLPRNCQLNGIKTLRFSCVTIQNSAVTIFLLP